MTKVLEKRLAKLESVLTPQPLVNILLVADDDPDKERLVAEHQRGIVEQHGTADLPFPTVIVLVAAKGEECR